jgi:hypothetical protein
MGSMLVAGALTATTSAPGVVATLYLQDVLGYSAAVAGLVVLPLSVSVIAGSALGPDLIRRAGARGAMSLGLAAVCCGAIADSRLAATGELAWALAGGALGGLGLGAASVAATACGMGSVRGGAARARLGDARLGRAGRDGARRRRFRPGGERQGIRAGLPRRRRVGRRGGAGGAPQFRRRPPRERRVRSVGVNAPVTLMDGFMEQRAHPKPVVPSRAARDPEVARRLWEVSEEMTGCASRRPARRREGAAHRPGAA